jgi:predicted nuclease of restriction endonuclease-like RecB superfamily
VRKRAGRITPVFLRGETRDRMRPVAGAVVRAFEASVGKTRAELDELLAGVPKPARDRVTVLGLIKLCEDRCETSAPEGLDPAVVRREVFLRSSAAWRADAGFDRAAVLLAAAEALGTTGARVEQALFADLADAQVIRSFEPLEADELLARYDLALAQSVLLRATRVEVDLPATDPAAMRGIFRAARFHGLVHAVHEREGGGQRLVVDGPFSLFDAVQRYGLKLATFLPHVLACPDFELRAEVLHGPKRERLELVLTPKDGVHPGRLPSTGARPELDALVDAFEALGSSWRVRRAEQVIARPGEPVVVPDLVFEQPSTGRRVWLEAFGFWSRAAIWRRIEQIRAGLPEPMLLVASKKLRVSEELLDESEAAELYVYGAAIGAREVLSRIERIAGAKATR